MSDVRTLHAPAKVNLFLHVGAAREDGRHDLDSLVVFAGASASDVLNFEAAEAFSLTVTGDTAQAVGPLQDNLVCRAVKDMETASGAPLSYAVHLEKRLPVAAGMGGGSADAGAALRALHEACGLDREAALSIAAHLGGDVPAAFVNRPLLMRGDGDHVSEVHGLPSVPAVLVNSGCACPTGAVFRQFDALGGGEGFSETPLPQFESVAGLIDWLSEKTRNDLEAPAIDLVPEIAETLGTLRDVSGADFVRMSGSGATCFAVFETLAEAEQVAGDLAIAKPGWWISATLLGEGAA